MNAPTAAPQRILIVKLSSLGDVIHTLPVVHDLHQRWPLAQIDWVVEPGFAPLLRRAPGVHRIIECAQRRWRQRGLAGLWAADVRAEKRRFLAELRAQAYDLVLDLQGLTKSALVARQARLSATGVRVAMANRTEGSGYEAPTRWLAHQAIALEPHVHALDRARRMAARVLAAPDAARQLVQPVGPPNFGLRGTVAASQSIGPHAQLPCMLFVHGTSRDDKLWPDDHWIALGQRFLAAGWRLAVPQGSAVEAERAARLQAALGTAHLEIWPRMALDELLDRMAQVHGVIGVDSGLSHLAVALDLCHLQLYNFATAWRTGPQASHGHAYQRSIEGEPLANSTVPGALQPPSVDAVWAAWLGVAAADAARGNHVAPAACSASITAASSPC